MLLNLVSLLGIFGLCFIAWCFSEDRRLLPIKVMVWGLGLQMVIGALVFLVPPTQKFVLFLNDVLNAVIDASEAGSRFLFGPLFVPPKSLLLFSTQPEQASSPILAGRWVARALSAPYVSGVGDRLGGMNLDMGFVLAFRVLPQVIFFSAVVGLLYHLGVIQPVVRVFAQLFRRTMNLSGAESLSGAANIFVGIESAIAVKPFLADMTRSELCAILASCFGSIASTVLALYASFLRPVFPTITGHLMSASILTIPACFVIAKILVPETGVPATLGVVPDDPEEEGGEKKNAMDSLIVGALDGVKLAVGIAAVIIAIIGVKEVINMVFLNLESLSTHPNFFFSLIGQFFAIVNLENILGALFFIPTCLTGVSFNLGEIWQSSILIGSRLLETSIPPYIKLAQLSAAGEISDRAMLIISYILCGFAHIPSVGIFAGGLSSLVPSRRHDISEIVWKALLAGTLATLMTGCIAGIFFNPANSSILGL